MADDKSIITYIYTNDVKVKRDKNTEYTQNRKGRP